MTQKDTSRIHDIAMQTMKTWIEQQIFETAPPPQNAACEDQVQCIVNKTIDWRRDYISVLQAARSFDSLNDYDAAIAMIKTKLESANKEGKQAVHNALSATNAEDFNDAAHDIMRPIPLMTQEVFLKKVRRVFVYLHGKMEDSEDFLHIGPTPEGYSRNLLAIMKEHGTFNEWEGLISKLPHPAKTAYTQHIAGWGAPKP